MTEVNKDREKADPPTPVLDYACTPWRASSQHAASLYRSGTRLWTKADLADIEKQLENSFGLKEFTLRDLNRKEFRIRNPCFGIEQPIWKPMVKFRGYWSLVLEKAEGPDELSCCTYVIEWKNTANYDFVGTIEDWEDLFETKRQLWLASITCRSFKAQLNKTLAKVKYNVTKVVCLGLGDFTRRHYEVDKQRLMPDMESTSPMIQHALALTVADEIRKHNLDVRLIAQDPDYRHWTSSFLCTKGFEVKGQFGAGVLAELDETTLVIYAYPSAPLRQIIADIARPVIQIANQRDHRIIASYKHKPYADSESPRSLEMWKEYESEEVQVSAVEREMVDGGLNCFSMFTRK